MDVTRNVWRKLNETPSVAQLVTAIHRWELRESVEGTGGRALVITAPRSWSATRHNTAAFPLVVVACYADPSRTPSGHVEAEDQEERALEAIHAVRKALHVPEGGEIEWGGLRVLSSTAAGGPDVHRVADHEQIARAATRFEVVVG